ncbi:NUDIX hydrolase [Anaerolineales bacterium]
MTEWAGWVEQLIAIAKIGLEFSENPYDRDRYEQIIDIAAAIGSRYSGDEAEQIKAFYTENNGYVTPKIDVRAAIFDEDRVLMVRELSDDGRWTLPGGWCDVGDTPAESVKKEVKEEAGYEVEVVKLAAVLDRAREGHPPYPFSTYKLLFICKVVGGDGDHIHKHETGDLHYFPIDALPADLSPNRVLPHQILRLYQHAQDPTLPTDFN